MKRLLYSLLVAALILSGTAFSQAQGQTHDSASGKETVQSGVVKSPDPKAKEKSRSGPSPKAQIKEGGKEIGAGFRELFLGIGKGFKNMGQAIKKAWTGESGK